MLDQKEAIPFLSPDRERLLEYDISRAISRVMTPEKPVVGVMSPLPVGTREPDDDAHGPPGNTPWVLYTELKRDFNVKQVEMTADKIPTTMKVLVVIHPKAITDAAQYAIDQFVLRGGKLIAFLDPLCALDRQAWQWARGRQAARRSTSCSRPGASASTPRKSVADSITSAAPARAGRRGARAHREGR